MYALSVFSFFWNEGRLVHVRCSLCMYVSRGILGLRSTLEWWEVDGLRLDMYMLDFMGISRVMVMVWKYSRLQISWAQRYDRE